MTVLQKMIVISICLNWQNNRRSSDLHWNAAKKGSEIQGQREIQCLLKSHQNSSVGHGAVRERSRKERMRVWRGADHGKRETGGRNLHNKSVQHLLYTHRLQHTVKLPGREKNNPWAEMTTTNVSAVSHSLLPRLQVSGQHAPTWMHREYATFSHMAISCYTTGLYCYTFVTIWHCRLNCQRKQTTQLADFTNTSNREHVK